MKIYLSADIEGVTNVTHWDETEIDKPGYQAAREQMSAEVAAACKGVHIGELGEVEVFVKDAHHTARNLIPSALEPWYDHLIRGWSGSPLMMAEGLDESFGAAMCIGYHSPAASNTNPLAHTMTGTVQKLWINDQIVSEFRLFAYTSALFGVPVVFISGDRGICDEAQMLNPNISVLAVKEGVGNATSSLPPQVAVSSIEYIVKEALRGDYASCRIALPDHFSVRIEYRHHHDAYRNGFYPGAHQAGTHTIEFETDNFFEVLRFLMFVV